MKHILHPLALVCLLFITNHSSAQHVGFKAGMNYANMNMSASDDRFDGNTSKGLLGFHMGVFGEYLLNEKGSIEAGLFYDTKGDNTNLKEAGTSQTIQAYYLDIPITYKHRVVISDNFTFYGNIGPYLGIGLGGTVANNVGSKKIEENINWGNTSTDDLIYFDGGLAAGIGFENNGFIMGLSYNYGIANVSSYIGNNTSATNNHLSLSIGYVFKDLFSLGNKK